MFSIRLFTLNLLRMSGFLSRYSLVRPNNGHSNLICATSSFWASRMFTDYNLYRLNIPLTAQNLQAEKSVRKENRVYEFYGLEVLRDLTQILLAHRDWT